MPAENPYEQRRRAKDHRAAGRFIEAAVEYGHLWRNLDPSDPWDGWGLALSLRKAGDSAEALAVAQAVLAIDPDHSFTRSVAGWCLYDLHIRGAERSTPTLCAALEQIREHSDHLADGRQEAFSPFPIAAFQAARLFDDAGDFASLADLLEDLDPAKLACTAKQADDGKRWPSDAERWHRGRTKALAKLERWHELRSACSEALASGVRFDPGQETWIRYRLAIAEWRLRNLGVAAEQLRDLTKRSSLPPIHATFASVHIEMGDDPAAIGEYAQALLGTQDLGTAVKWLESFACALERLRKLDDARDHASLAVAVRKNNNWPIPRSLADLAVRLGAPPGAESWELQRRLKRSWERWSEAATPTRQGTVKSVLAAGSGFISSDDIEYYFAPNEGRRTHLAIGTVVKFEPYERYDKKKDRMGPAARKLRVA